MILAGVVSVLAAACGTSSSLPYATAPSAVEPSTGGSGTGVSSTRAVDPAEPSCPSEAPTGLVVTTNGTGAEARWNAVANAQDYLLEVTRRQATNQYTMVDGFPVAEDKLVRDFVLREEGRYQARVRARACGAYGNWSPVFEFSSDGVPSAPPKVGCEEEECFIDR